MFVIYKKWKKKIIEDMQSKQYEEGGQKNTQEQARGPPGLPELCNPQGTTTR
jgi:hypothetical protein